MDRDTRNKVALGAILLLAVAGLFVRQSYPLFVMSMICVNAVLVLSLNFIIGFAGQVFFGTVGFFAVAAYITGRTMTVFQWSWWTALPFTILGTMLISFVVGLPSLRVNGYYLSIMSTGFITVINDILRNWADASGGVFGVMGITRPSVFGFALTENLHYFWFCLAVLTFMTWWAVKIEDSRYGRAFKAVRDDELATQLLGISPTFAKMFAFLIGGFYTGVAGSLFGPLHGFISPETFVANYNTLFMSMLIVGGLSTVPGCVTGSIVLTVLTEVLRPLREKYLTAYALFIILIMKFEPLGMLGIIGRIIRYFKSLSRNVPPAGGELRERAAVR